MSMQDLVQEYGLEIDDVRWYLSVQHARRLLEYTQRVKELAEHIWRGELETQLYDMEEEYLRQLQSELDRAVRDEHSIREILNEVVTEKRRRHESDSQVR